MPPQKSAADKIADVDSENRLFAERRRLKAQAEDLASGKTTLTDQLSPEARNKLHYAWIHLTNHRAFYQSYDQLESYIAHRTLEDNAFPLKPDMMAPQNRTATNDQLLSLIEVEHDVLSVVAADPSFGNAPYPGLSAEWIAVVEAAPESFRTRVNKILEDHTVKFYLQQNSELAPVDSQEMHNEVVAPTLHLLHSQPQFAAAEAAYQKALAELRVRDAGDAITDAGVALQEVLTALGCEGNALGDLFKSARKTGLLKGKDTPLTEAIGRTGDWVAAMRNQGEAHKGNPEVDMPDAWMVVHVVGALIRRLSEAGGAET